MERGKNRIVGYDFARALALLGMVVINLWVFMEDETPLPKWLVFALELMQGRAAATFVVLAGVGLSLLSRELYLNKSAAGITEVRCKLIFRALFLFVLGLLNSIIWQADILHFYAVYFVIGAFLILLPNRDLLGLMIISVAAFSLLMALSGFDRDYEWGDVNLQEILNFPGMIRHLFFEGLYPVFPWIAFLILGLWLGRKHFSSRGHRIAALTVGVLAVASSEFVSWAVSCLAFFKIYGVTETLLEWLTLDPWEPMPLFFLSGGGTALIVISLSMLLSDRHGLSKWFSHVVAVGQMTLTHYVAHILFGSLAFEMIGAFNMDASLFPLWGTIIFYTCALFFSFNWRNRFQRGPLEWLMHRFIFLSTHPKVLLCRKTTLQN